MNLYLSKLPKREDINSNYLTNLFTNKGNRRGISFESHLAKNNMNFNPKNLKSPQALERKFQFNFVVKTYNSLMKIRKRNSNNSVENKTKSPRLYLPIIKEFNLTKKSNDNSNDNKTKDDEYNLNTYFHQNENNNNNYIKLKNIPFYDDELNDFFSKSRNVLEKSNSTLSQSLINNRSNISSKYINENKNDKIKFRNLSHSSIFEEYKKQFLSSVQKYKTRNKLAEITFKEKLEKIKNEKIQKSKNEELFKEYELKFNPEKFTEKLKSEFQFFKNDNKRILKQRTMDENVLPRKKIFKGIKNNEDNKNNLYYYEMKHNGIKPSQRIIQNMLRREKKIELYEKSLIDLKE